MALHIFDRLHDRLGEVPILGTLLSFWWRRSMIRAHRLPRRWFDGSVDGFLPEDVIDIVLGFDAENPEREGCPSVQILRELAARRRPIDDPWYTHLLSCSNCYRQVRASQQFPGRRRQATHETIH